MAKRGYHRLGMATEAGLMRCPNCGGDVAQSARTCGYCHAELATIRCHHCFAMNAAHSLHCAGCGRELGLEPVGENDERPCPTCKKPLVEFRGNGGVLLDCTACGGQFVEHALLSSLLEAREIAGLAVTRRARRSALEISVRYVPCPSCGQLMNRKNFGGESGVVVDVCSTHGTWFEEGELPRVLAFVESGGLALSQARKRERERREARERALRPIALSGADTKNEPLVRSSDMQEIADATIELFEWLTSRILGR
jgi:Zn-finger nucleic acid-binding protein